MAKNDRLLKLAQKLSEKVGLTDMIDNKEQAGLVMVDIMKDLDTMTLVRELVKENGNDSDLGNLVRVLISSSMKK